MGHMTCRLPVGWRQLGKCTAPPEKAKKSSAARDRHPAHSVVSHRHCRQCLPDAAKNSEGFGFGMSSPLPQRTQQAHLPAEN